MISFLIFDNNDSLHPYIDIVNVKCFESDLLHIIVIQMVRSSFRILNSHRRYRVTLPPQTDNEQEKEKQHEEKEEQWIDTLRTIGIGLSIGLCVLLLYVHFVVDKPPR